MAIPSAIFDAYRYHRAANRRRPAMLALRMARDDAANGTRRYCYSDTAGAGAPFTSGRDTLRHLSDYAALGFRLLGFADEIAPRSVEHSGWFTRANDFDTDTYRGAVFLLPGRNGNARAVPGYIESENPEDAIIALGRVTEYNARGWWGRMDNSEFMDTALEADSIAQHAAEEAREYDAAWQAGARHAYNMQRIAEARKEAREVARAARDNVKNNPTICDVLRGKVRELRAEIRQLAEENESLRAGDFFRRDYYLGFYTGDPKLRAAFNEGAGGNIL